MTGKQHTFLSNGYGILTESLHKNSRERRNPKEELAQNKPWRKQQNVWAAPEQIQRYGLIVLWESMTKPVTSLSHALMLKEHIQIKIGETNSIQLIMLAISFNIKIILALK